MLSMSVFIIAANAQIKRSQTSKKTVAAKSIKVERMKFDMKMQPDGTYLTDNKQSFYVVNFPGKTAAQLFSDVAVNISKVYSSPEKVTEKIEGRSIIINGYQGEISRLDRHIGYVDLKYRIEIQFKEGRIRMNVPRILLFHVVDESLNEVDNYGPESLMIVCRNAASTFIDANKFFNTLYEAIAYGIPEEDW